MEQRHHNHQVEHFLTECPSQLLDWYPARSPLHLGEYQTCSMGDCIYPIDADDAYGFCPGHHQLDIAETFMWRGFDGGKAANCLYATWHINNAAKFFGLMERDAQSKTHYLYRLWDAGLELLYVGETCDVTRRLREHSKDKHWWHEVRGHTHEPFPDESSAYAAEQRAIKSENPRYNIAGRAA